MKTRIVRRSGLVFLSAVLLSPAVAVGQSPSADTGSLSVNLKLGAVVPEAPAYDNGFAIEAGVAHRFHRNLALELSVGRFSTSRSVVAGPGVVVTATKVAYPALLSAKVIVPFERLELYGLAGGGIYFMSGEIDATNEPRMAFSGSSNPLGFHVGAGTNIKVARRLALALELKYAVGEASVFRDSGTIFAEDKEFNSLLVGAGFVLTL